MACVSKWEVKGHEEEENILRVKIKDKIRMESFKKMGNLVIKEGVWKEGPNINLSWKIFWPWKIDSWTKGIAMYTQQNCFFSFKNIFYKLI